MTRSILKCSIIVPVFNTEKYLPQCLDSILNQTLKNFEVICVDNGSTDGSINVINNYQEHYKNIHFFSHSQGRQGAARNIGMKTAEGEFIGFVDSDDFVDITMFEKMSTLATKNNAEMVICNIKNYYEDRQSYQDNFPSSWFPENNLLDFNVDQRLFRNHTICNKLFRRSFLEQIHLQFPENLYHEDVYFVMKGYLSAQKVCSINEPLYFYRKRTCDSVNSNLNSNALMIFPIMKKLWKDILYNQSMIEYKNSINEVKVFKYLSFYSLTTGKTQQNLYDQMKNEFMKMTLPNELKVLTPSEYKNYLLAQKSSYLIFSLLMTIKDFLGQLLKISFINTLYLKIKGVY